MERPKCIKCPNPALTLWNDMWICGNCMHEFIQERIKQNQKVFLKE